MDNKPDIVHNEQANRYELWIEGELASLAEYRPVSGPQGDVLVFDHTETRQAFRGGGLAERVVRFALEDVRERGKRVVPQCWFVAEVMEANPEYADLRAA